MMRYLTGSTSRGALCACALLAIGAAAPAIAQAPTLNLPPPPAAPQAAPAPAPTGLSESVAAVVNDDIVSTYDLSQRMRLLIATSGIQPTEENLPQFQREALVSLVDEHLQFQELRRVQKEQKIDIIADEAEVDEEIADMAKGNNMSREQFAQFLAQRGIGVDTLKQQIRAQISWARWIRGRYGSRLRIGEDQISAMQSRLVAEA